ncbi:MULTISPECIES: SSI family serine proteinase inhibitor [Glycomyces]|uniref:SSI family serine proteinase inhibitor n=2 Tax=Glycomyces TaxID=58113 RepID=A0A9X3PMX1_9ACTN|nr:SSI family serine proteinase inhibitor [Glycomyces lechevalierae]MDA1386523.1 SSI family serine proteinase inhibitor [Glycomyces lechevalierae]MDR7340590.1 hypothetical protein [Glycomyces lechevalierae]
MLKQFVSAAAVFGAAALVQGVAAGPAQALHADAPHSDFQILVVSPDPDEPTQMTLACPPELSEHPNAKTVCAQLDAAEGFIQGIPAADGMCTKEYAPVQVLVFGHWQGSNRTFNATYNNRCEAVLATGGALLDL